MYRPYNNAKSKPCLKTRRDGIQWVLYVHRFKSSVVRGHSSWFFDIVKQWFQFFRLFFSLRIHLAVGDFQNEITRYILAMGLGFLVFGWAFAIKRHYKAEKKTMENSLKMQEIMPRRNDGEKSEEGYCGAPQINLHLSPLPQRCSSDVDVGRRWKLHMQILKRKKNCERCRQLKATLLHWDANYNIGIVLNMFMHYKWPFIHFCLLTIIIIKVDLKKKCGFVFCQ